MENYLFSKRNVDNQCLQLMRTVKMQNTPKNLQLCRSLITQRMKMVYDKYGSKRPQNMPQKDFAGKLCKKVVSDCTIGLRKMQSQRANNTEFSGLSADAPSGYAPVQTGNGGFISATGEMGGRMEFRGERGNNTLQNKPPPEDLEAAMAMRMSGYDQRGGMMGNHGGPPQNIDFSLDDETTRRHRPDNQQRNGGNMMDNGNIGMNNQDMSQFFSGFEGFNGGNLDENYGGIDSSGMFNNPTGNGETTPLGVNDANAAFNRLQNERDNMDNTLSQPRNGQGFNPMNAPNQQMQMKQQFNPRVQHEYGQIAQPTNDRQLQYNPQIPQQYNQQPRQQLQYNPQIPQQYNQQPRQQLQYNPQIQQQRQQLQYNPQIPQQYNRQMTQQSQQKMPQYNMQQYAQQPVYNPNQINGQHMSQQPNNFFQVIPCEEEGMKTMPSHAGLVDNKYLQIVNEIIQTGDLSATKTLSAAETERVLTILKLSSDNEHENETIDKSNMVDSIVSHDIQIKKPVCQDGKQRKIDIIESNNPSKKSIIVSTSKKDVMTSGTQLPQQEKNMEQSKEQNDEQNKEQMVQLIDSQKLDDMQSNSSQSALDESQICVINDVLKSTKTTPQIESVDECTDKIVENGNVDRNNIIKINEIGYDIDEYLDDPKYYNDFMISLKEPIENASKLVLNNLEIYNNPNNINNCNNNIVFSNQDGEHLITVTPGKYDIVKLIDDLNETMSENKIDIEFTLRGDNRINIKSENVFAMKNDKFSLLRVLGFVDKKYNGSVTYTSDNKYILSNNIDAQLQLIYNGNKNFMSKIYARDLKDGKICTKRMDKDIGPIGTIIFKIRQDNGTLYDLCGNAPKISIVFN